MKICPKQTQDASSRPPGFWIFGLSGVLLCSCLSSIALAGTGDFRGVVRTVDVVAVAREQIHVDAVGVYSTTDSGEFTIPASVGLKVDAEVVFHVTHWVVLRPCELQNGRTYLPPPERSIQIRVLHRGDKRLKSIAPIESAIGCLIEEEASRFPKRPALGSRNPSSWLWLEPSVSGDVAKANASLVNLGLHGDRPHLDMAGGVYFQHVGQAQVNAFAQPENAERNEFLARKAEEWGFSAEELESAINEWADSTSDPYQRGLGALWRGRFAEARRYISESISSSPEGDVKRYLPLARAEFEQAAYEDAAAALRKVLAVHPNDSVILADLKIVEAQAPSGKRDLPWEVYVAAVFVLEGILFLYFVRRLNRELQESKSSHAGLKVSYEESRKSLGTLTLSHEESKSSHAGLKVSYEELKASYEESRKSLETLKASHKELEASHEELEASHVGLKASYEKFKAGHEESKASQQKASASS